MLNNAILELIYTELVFLADLKRLQQALLKNPGISAAHHNIKTLSDNYALAAHEYHNFVGAKMSQLLVDDKTEKNVMKILDDLAAAKDFESKEELKKDLMGIIKNSSKENEAHFLTWGKELYEANGFRRTFYDLIEAAVNYTKLYELKGINEGVITQSLAIVPVQRPPKLEMLGVGIIKELDKNKKSLDETALHVDEKMFGEKIQNLKYVVSSINEVDAILLAPSFLDVFDNAEGKDLRNVYLSACKLLLLLDRNHLTNTADYADEIKRYLGQVAWLTEKVWAKDIEYDSGFELDRGFEMIEKVAEIVKASLFTLTPQDIARIEPVEPKLDARQSASIISEIMHHLTDAWDYPNELPENPKAVLNLIDKYQIKLDQKSKKILNISLAIDVLDHELKALQDFIKELALNNSKDAKSLKLYNKRLHKFTRHCELQKARLLNIKKIDRLQLEAVNKTISRIMKADALIVKDAGPAIVAALDNKSTTMHKHPSSNNITWDQIMHKTATAVKAANLIQSGINERFIIEESKKSLIVHDNVQNNKDTTLCLDPDNLPKVVFSRNWFAHYEYDAARIDRAQEKIINNMLSTFKLLPPGYTVVIGNCAYDPRAAIYLRAKAKEEFGLKVEYDNQTWMAVKAYYLKPELPAIRKKIGQGMKYIRKKLTSPKTDPGIAPDLGTQDIRGRNEP